MANRRSPNLTFGKYPLELARLHKHNWKRVQTGHYEYLGLGNAGSTFSLCLLMWDRRPTCLFVMSSWCVPCLRPHRIDASSIDVYTNSSVSPRVFQSARRFPYLIECRPDAFPIYVYAGSTFSLLNGTPDRRRPCCFVCRIDVTPTDCKKQNLKIGRNLTLQL